MTASDWDEVYQQYHGKVMGYITARVQRREDAEDLCADVFEKIYKKIETYNQEKAAVGTWIYTIARNTVIDYYRMSKPTVELDEKLPSGETADQSILKEETLRELAAAIRELPPELQNIIVLVYGQRKTLLEVSRMIHYSYRTTKLKHQKALALMREKMKA